MASTVPIFRPSSPSDATNRAVPEGVAWAARAGYLAKGVVYGMVGGLALQQALGRGGDTTGTREALQRIGSAPFGQALLWAMVVGLAGYVAWRLVQAFVDPEGGSDGDHRRWPTRLFYFGSAVAYAVLAWSAVELVTGAGGGSASGGGSHQSWAARLMEMTWGVWLVGALGLGMVGRGLLQLWKAYTGRFREKIGSFDLGPIRERWTVAASRLGLTARGVIFGIIGGSFIHAAVTHDPDQARGLERSLEFLVTSPWLLGSVGLGLMGYAVYQGVKARYRLMGI